MPLIPLKCTCRINPNFWSPLQAWACCGVAFRFLFSVCLTFFLQFSPLFFLLAAPNSCRYFKCNLSQLVRWADARINSSAVCIALMRNLICGEQQRVCVAWLCQCFCYMEVTPMKENHLMKWSWICSVLQLMWVVGELLKSEMELKMSQYGIFHLLCTCEIILLLKGQWMFVGWLPLELILSPWQQFVFLCVRAMLYMEHKFKILNLISGWNQSYYL